MTGATICGFAIAVGYVTAFVTLLSVHLHRRSGLSWWALPVLVTAVVLGVDLAGPANARSMLWPYEEGGAPALVLLAGILLGSAVLLWRRRFGGAGAALGSLALLPIPALSWIPRNGRLGLLPHWRDSLHTCVTGHFFGGEQVTRGIITHDALPNLVFYLPLGLAGAALLRRQRWAVVPFALLVSAGTELYQGAFTDRSCQQSDVAANVAGTAVGAALVLLLDLAMRLRLSRATGRVRRRAPGR